MRLELANHKATLVDVNPRAEIHGTSKEPAADLKFSIDVQNSRLEIFDAGLLPALYFFDEKNPANDLAAKGSSAPNRRLTCIPMPLKIAAEMIGGRLTVHRGLGGAHSNVVLSDIKVGDFKIDAKEGGTVEIVFRVQCHPEEDQFGKLSVLIQQEVEISIEPPGEEIPAQQSLLAGGDGATGAGTAG